MTKNTPSGAKKHRESTEPESHQTAKMIFFFFFFFFFRRANSNSRDSFTMVFAQNSSIFHWAVHQPITLSREAIRTTHSRTMAAFATPFFFTCTHVHKSLSNQIWLLRKFAELEILLVCGECLKKLMILQPILHRKPVWGDLLPCNRWQTSFQACICC